jgi:saccharopepsin
MDSTTGLLTITPAQYARLQPLNFEIGSAGTFTLPPNGQIWPRSLNAQIGGNSSFIYLIVNDVSMRASPSSAVC